MIVAPVLGRVLGDHGTGEAAPRVVLEFGHRVRHVVDVQHRDGFQTIRVGAAKIRQPVIVRAKYRREQLRIRDLEVE